MIDLSIFATPEAWISLVTLLFLEIVLGVDNLVFIAITTDRLAPEKQHIGRKVGLLGALVMRILFLCFASFLVHMTHPLFSIPFIEIHGEPMGFSIRDLVLLVGGIYLIYKGIIELKGVLELTEEKEAQEPSHKRTRITLPQAVITIMVMDLVFSIDSVITAVGLAQHLIIMILAVIIAVILMMIFVDAISRFINTHTEIKILALVFIVTIGILLTLDGLGIHSGIELLDMHVEKLMVYFAMIFSVIIQLIQMKYKKNYQAWVAQKNREMDSSQDRDHLA
jgi:predicted tellurium resistance membrane protein TerC